MKITTFHFFRTLLAILPLFVVTYPARAANTNWLGNTSVNWNTAGNWNPSGVPLAGSSLFFVTAGTAGANLNNNITAASFSSITFSNGASAFTFKGNSFGITSGITNNSSNAQAITNAIALGANATISDSGGGTTLAGVVSGTFNLTKILGGTLTLQGVNTYSGNTVITAGTLLIGGAGQLGSGSYAGLITDNSTFTYNSSAAQTLSGVISGTGTLNQNGSGTLTLSATNTYSGNTAINGGTLLIGGAGRLGSGSYVGLVTNNGVFTYNSSAAQTLSGVISGTGSLNQNGSGTLTLSAANTYSGNTTIGGGTLLINGAGQLGSGSYAGLITDNSTFTYNSSAAQTLSGVISGTGTLNQNGSGTLTLSNSANTFAGGLTINAGTVNVVGAGGSSGLGGGNTTVNSGGTLVGTGGNAFGYFPNTAPGTIIINGGTVTESGTANYAITMPNLTFTGGTLTSPAGNTGDASYGNYALYGPATFCTVTTLSNNTTAVISAGTISLEAFNGQTTFNVAAGNVTNGATPGVDLLISSVIENVAPYPAAGIIKSGAGVMELTGTNTFADSLSINAGTLLIGGAGQLGSGSYAGLITDNGTFTYNSSAAQTLSEAISGTGALNKNGSSTLTLTAANTYSGNTTINAGTLLIGGSGRLGAPVITITTTNQTGAVPFTPTWTAASGSLISGLAPTTATGNFGEYTGANATNLTASGIPLTIYIYNTPQATNLEVCGNDGTAGSLLVYTLPASTYGYNLTNITVYGGWQDAGRDAQDYTVYYSTVANPSNFIFLTSVSYVPSNPSATGDATRVIINNTAGAAIANNVAALKFDFTTPTSAQENGASGYTAINVFGTAASQAGGGNNYTGLITNNSTFTYNSSAPQTLSGVISGTGDLNKLGSGTLALSATNTYSGFTSISAGTLALAAAGSINNSSTISISAGATFDVSLITNYSASLRLSVSGTGTTLGSTAAAINGGTTVRLQTNPVTLIFAPAGSNGDTTHPPLLVSQGALTITNSAITVVNVSATALGAGTYRLIQVTGGTLNGPSNSTVTVTGNGGGILSGSTASLSVSGGNLNLVVSPVPVTISSGLSANNKVYDGTTTATISSNNVVLSGVVAADTNNVKLSTNSYSATFASAGTNNGISVAVSGLTLTGSTAANYTLTQPTLSANITAATVTVTSGLNANNKVYDGTTVATINSNNVVLSGVVAGDASNVKLSTNSYSATFTSAAVGNGKTVTVSGLTLTGSVATNYTLTQPTLSANITSASILNTVTSSLNPALPSSNVTFTATLSVVSPGGGTPTGNVIFKDGAAAFGTNALNGSAVASFSTTTLSHGSHTITAGYAGDGNFLGSTNSLSPNQIINTPPVAVNDTIGRYSTKGTKVRLSTLLTNDSDADGDTITTTVSSTNANGAMITASNSWVFYTPLAGFTNADSFTYTNADGYGGSAIGTVSVVILTDTASSQNVAGIDNLGNGSSLIHFSEIPGRTYTIQYTTNLVTPNWQSLGTAAADAVGKIDFTDSPGTNSPPRFYRSTYP